MKTSLSLAVLASGLSFSATALAGGIPGYFLKEDIVGYGFYSHFNWQNIDDPTHGRVVYVDEPTSIRENLTYADYNTFVLRTDHKAVLDAAGPGRKSVRIYTKNTYSTHVAVFDIRHMPQGCGTWPAIWATTPPGSTWPNGGEVDILEGVNDQGPNAATLHTVEGCTMPPIRSETGTPGQNDCNWLVNYNTGCTVKMTSQQNTYGPGFNANGGGWYAIERTGDHISVWFWPRNSPSVPNDVRRGGVTANPANWGTPAAFFPNTSCDMNKYFAEHNIIINLTLCGDWAGQSDVWAASGCPSNCVDYVNNNPNAFSDAYFDFNSIRIYQPSPFAHFRRDMH